MGEAPEWYWDIQAARYLGVAPWELAAQSIEWRNRALVAMSAEAEARDT
ncbi:MAG TPA: hypothetical protein PLJ35_15690 [Anaerolineae bacterium]|nr:hypothetical protein [Anaerolineae bacterium]HOR00253.1 hypothetical protein [Anaerolineae bacterium]HPL30624.1 hypothetical protein [Anaerolineae bacterium]